MEGGEKEVHLDKNSEKGKKKSMQSSVKDGTLNFELVPEMNQSEWRCDPFIHVGRRVCWKLASWGLRLPKRRMLQLCMWEVVNSKYLTFDIVEEVNGRFRYI